MRAFAALHFCLSSCTALAGSAEYAIRWDPDQGGPSTAAEVVSLLKLTSSKAKVKTFEVRYFDVTQAPAVQATFKVIGRERTSSDAQTDATYKVRGPEPVPPDLVAWKCPLKGQSETKAEIDVGFVGLNEYKRSFSVSCTAEESSLLALLPPGYAAKARTCTSKMERTKTNSFKVERWSLPQGRSVIEVSMEGNDSDEDRERFRRQVVMPLMGQNVLPLADSKTDLGGAC
jgi:hypothetical protein